MTDLKPCPFCGETATVRYNTVFDFVPWCKNPDCILNDLMLGYETEEKAIEAWNRRADNGEAD